MWFNFHCSWGWNCVRMFRGETILIIKVLPELLHITGFLWQPHQPSTQQEEALNRLSLFFFQRVSTPERHSFNSPANSAPIQTLNVMLNKWEWEWISVRRVKKKHNSDSKTFKPFHMANRESLWAMVGVAQRCVHGVQRIRRGRWPWCHPDVQEGRVRRLTLSAVERHKGFPQRSIRPLKCWSAAWVSRGDELAVQHGENWLLIFSLWHTHGLTLTDTHRLQAWRTSKGGQSTQRETWRMKGLDEKKCRNLFRHLTQFYALDAEIIWQYFSIWSAVQSLAAALVVGRASDWK